MSSKEPFPSKINSFQRKNLQELTNESTLNRKIHNAILVLPF